jgi:hypothetical protein
MMFALAASSMQAQVSNLFQITEGSFDTHLDYHRVIIQKGDELELADLTGPGKVTYFYFTDDSKGHLYPGLVLKVFWDGEQTPSIAVPLGDFFGAIGGEAIDYHSAAMEINHLCYASYLPMPFSSRARFVLANDGDVEYRQLIAYGFDYEKSSAFAAEKSRLHAAWRRSNPTDGMHTILEAKGTGHYVGNFLRVATHYAGWWGEGDTIFHIDGRKITHTPGTEDEYGSCWGLDELYSHAYNGYIEKGGGKNRMYRWYVVNPVRFSEGLKVEIQDQRWERAQVPSQNDFTSVAYWYQQEPHAEIVLAPYGERVGASKAAEYK